ncbi:MAG TPA: PmeII family type II restriction endonuclease [Anaerolineaceae bacterium]|nr:PmeII family type II restriction endonuclease [Anaerolineaceae bacterium]
MINPINLDEVKEYVNSNIDAFHNKRIESLRGLKLNALVAKNPYLFRAKNVNTASQFVELVLEAFLSSSEEKQFGNFLEDLAIFIAEKTSGGHKSTASGVDLEFIRERNHYLVSIKSGPKWGNSDQHTQLAKSLQTAVARLMQSHLDINPKPVLGICYGKTKTSFVRGYMKVVGQNFWYLISGSKTLYTDIIEPLGFRAKEHNDEFNKARANISNLLVMQFCDEYCNPLTGSINWVKLVESNSGNIDLDEFLN